MQRFRTHLYSLKMENKITDWTDRMIKTGTSWSEKIQKELDESDHIIYLLSPDFLATPYIMDVELKKGIEKNDRDQSAMQFIHIQDCNWQNHPKLSSLQHLLDPNKVGKDILVVNDPMNDKAWVTIINDLRNVLKDK